MSTPHRTFRIGLPRSPGARAVWLLAGGAGLVGLASLLALGRGTHSERALVAASVAPESEPAPDQAGTLAAVKAPPVATAARAAIAAPVAATALPSTATLVNAPVCEGVRLVEVAVQEQATNVWLGDAQGIEQLQPGQRFRQYTLLAVEPQTEQSGAVALLRGPTSNCRTASKTESFSALLNHADQAPPEAVADAIEPAPAAALTPGVANQLLAALQLQMPKKTDTQP